MSAESWQPTARCLLDLCERFDTARYLDIGGGLGVPEKPGQVPLDLSALDVDLSALKAEAGDRQLWLEPGRFIVAQSGVLLAQATQTKGKGDVQYLGVRTGMNSLIRPALYGAYHHIEPVRPRPGDPQPCDVVGPVCETADTFGRGRLLPPVEVGDRIAIRDTGAYGAVMASNYNRRPMAAEVMTTPGDWRVVRRRQTVDGMLQWDE